MTSVDILVVGIGFAGATSARVLADAGYRVHLVDRRGHIAGNAYDTTDAHGVVVHPYGPHIFHTNSSRIMGFLSRFTAWRPYTHRVLAKVGRQLLPVPINRSTINRLYGLDLDEAGVAAFFARVREPRESLTTSEDVVINSVGRDLCNKFYRGYTRKHWGLELADIAAGVAARIPVRTDADDRYFTDVHQCMPAEGYTAMFRRMLDHGLISYETGVDFGQVRNALRYAHLVYTGPIDAYFDFRYGRLPYRSIEFEHEHFPRVQRFQQVGTINYPNDHAYTRVTEFKHLTGQTHEGTSIVREYPRAQGEPFYPIPRQANEALFKRYQVAASECASVSFVGRLAQYRYYDMDQVVGAALTAAGRIVRSLGRDAS
ncbi:MAG TPA: UDP-galactopyranose mutase [Casimicrobiaceae bacterium]